MFVTFEVSDANKRKFKGSYEIADTAQACIEKWGDDVVHAQISQRIRARLGHKVRTWMNDNKTDAEITQLLKDYIPTKRDVSEEDEETKELKAIAREKDPLKKKELLEAQLKRLESVEG